MGTRRKHKSKQYSPSLLIFDNSKDFT